jgi:hypothetical protein
MIDVRIQIKSLTRCNQFCFSIAWESSQCSQIPAAPDLCKELCFSFVAHIIFRNTR